MKKRSTEILQRLVANPDEELSVRKLLREYHISEKTLRKDIEEILNFIRDAGVGPTLSFDSRSLRLEQNQDTQALSDAIYSMNLYDYKMSLEERKIYIIITLLNHKRYYSMQELSDEMYVTRNTIINDCRMVEDYLKEHQISFIAKSKMGIKIEGEEVRIENLLIDIFYSLIPSTQCENSFFVRFIMQKAGFHYLLSDVIYQMDRFTRKNNIIFAKEVFFEIAICVFVLLNRMRQAEYVRTVRSVSGSPLQLDMIGNMVDYVAAGLGASSVSRSDIISVEKIILLRDLHPKIRSINDFELYGVICHFLLEISNEINIDISSDDLLIKSLIPHVKSMSNWGDTEFDIEKDYGDFYVFSKIKAIAEKKFYILERYLQYKLDTKMQDSIVIYICAALLRNKENLCPCNVIVSCPGSMATSKYIAAQVKNYFNLNVVDTMTAKKVEAVGGNFKNIDFIVSTVAIHDSALPVVVVSPLLTIADINRIQGLAFQKSRKIPSEMRKKHLILSKIYSIYQTGDSEKIARLNSELEKTLEKISVVKSEATSQPALLKMLKPRYIKITDQKLEWKQAMQEASDDLRKDGYFDTKYVEEAIENVEEYGNYIIVSKGIALAHASNKGSGVYEDGISLLVAKNGIFFEDGDIVYLMFFFSQKGETDYLDLFKEIIELGKNQDNIEKIKKLGEGADVYSLIEEILSTY